MTAMFYTYDTVDREVVAASSEWPGNPRSAYRPVYWAGVSTWHRYVVTPEGERPLGARIPESEVPDVVRLYHMVNS